MYSRDELNEAQRCAVEHIDGPLLILAGPGSGKTRVVTQRIAYMLEQGVPGYHILALTFTNKAAEEMRQRVDALNPSSGVWVGTFHRYCAKVLRRHAEIVGLAANYTILDTSDSQLLLKRAAESLPDSLGMFSLSDVGSAISTAKSLGVTADSYQPRPGSPLGQVVFKVYPAYQKQLQIANAVDFDDLLLHVVTLLRDNPDIRKHYDGIHRFVMVDEYQDTNTAQYGIVRMLNFDHPNLAVTGDPDQSIYGWRGATIENILNFERDYPSAQVVRLEENYRSTPEILAVADQVIRNNRRRKEKKLLARSPSGDLPRIMKRRTQSEEADTIALELSQKLTKGDIKGEDVAIFYRVNALSRSLEKAFRQHGIPYQIVRGVSFFQRKEVKDLLAYLQLLNNPRNDAALVRIINVPTRGIGAKTLGTLSRTANDMGCCLLDAARSPEFAGQIAGRGRRAVGQFVELFDKLARHIDSPVEEILGRVVALTNYHDLLEGNENDTDAAGENDRAANVRELLNDAKEFDERFGDEPANELGGALEAYLEQVSLVNDVDGWDDKSARVTMMTLHASKGLEFPVVYLVGVEDGLLPHQRAKDTGDIEEERRLFFVGLTRAKVSLTLSHVGYRARRGGLHPAIPSPFLMEVPRDGVEWDDKSEFFDSGYSVGESFYDEPAIQYSVDSPAEGGSDHSDDSAKSQVNMAKLTTGAAMLADGSKSDFPRVSPDRFEQGMLVEHETHGLGKVISLSGSGNKRRATVQFFSGEERRFVIAHTPVRPVRSS